MQDNNNKYMSKITTMSTKTILKKLILIYIYIVQDPLFVLMITKKNLKKIQNGWKVMLKSLESTMKIQL